MRTEHVPTAPDRERPDQKQYQNQTPRDLPGPVPQAVAWQRALRVVRGRLN